MTLWGKNDWGVAHLTKYILDVSRRDSGKTFQLVACQEYRGLYSLTGITYLNKSTFGTVNAGFSPLS